MFAACIERHERDRATSDVEQMARRLAEVRPEVSSRSGGSYEFRYEVRDYLYEPHVEPAVLALLRREPEMHLVSKVVVERPYMSCGDYVTRVKFTIARVPVVKKDE